jgi:hypothetical protein
MLKRMEGLGARLGRGAAFAGLLAGAMALAAQAGWAEDSSRRAVSTRSDAGVTRSGTGSRSVSAPSPSSSARGSAGSRERTAAPRSGSPFDAAAAAHRRNEGRTAVPRSNAEGTRRRYQSHRDGGHGRGGHTVVVSRGWWYDPWWYGPAWGWGWGWYGSPWVWGPAGVRYDRPYRDGTDYGALDLDLWPDDVEVFVDGERVGEVDEYDGFPTFLWLPRGTYDVVFYRDGFQTLARQYSIYPGQVIDVNDRLERGESIRPEDLPSTSTANREARIERNRQRREAARRYEDWRERDGDRYEDDARVDEDELDEDEMAEAEEAYGDDEDQVQGGSMARLRLSITPEDASLYLDGNFLGTAREVGQLSAGLVVPPGSHRLEVVRPGYAPEEVRFDGEAGEEVSLQVDLERE